MFKSSITKFLIASLGILMIGLFIAALTLAIQAWNNYALAGRIARLTITDHTLFNALLTVRAQIPKNSTALIAQDEPRPVIEATHREASTTVAAALAALQSSDIANRAEFVAAIQAAWAKVQALQSSVYVEASRLRTRRNLYTIEPWRIAIHGMTDTLNTASVAVGNSVRIGDPLIAEMVQIRRTAWTIRDRYGLQCSMLRPNVDASLPLDAGQLDNWLGNRAVYIAAWHSLDEFLSRPGVSSGVRVRVALAREQTRQVQARVDAIVQRFDNSNKPAIASAAWTALCDGPFDSILDIAEQAQAEAANRAEVIRASSFRILVVAGMGLTMVVVFGAFAVVSVQHRLARPMKILTNAIARLSRHDFNTPVPATASRDELGSMAQALESLRASALEAEHLQQAMSRFTADASHQMRTPLTILRTHISVLGGLIPKNSEAVSSLNDIQEAADRLQHLLIQLLKLARAEGGQSVDSEAQTTDLREVIQAIAAKHVPQAVEASIDLHFEAAAGRFPVMANAIMLTEIFANLIDNAIRYNDAGGSVVIRLFEAHGASVVDIEDDGPGIPEPERNKVFTRFYRLNRDQTRSGSGLGLAIVQSLAETLHAEITMSVGANNRGLRVRVACR